MEIGASNHLAVAMAKAINEFGKEILVDDNLVMILEKHNGFEAMPRAKQILKMMFNIKGLKRIYSLKDARAKVLSELICQLGYTIKKEDEYSDYDLLNVFESILMGFELASIQKPNEEALASTQENPQSSGTKNYPTGKIKSEEESNLRNLKDNEPNNLLNLYNILSNSKNKEINGHGFINWLVEKSGGTLSDKHRIMDKRTLSVRYKDKFLKRSVRVHALDSYLEDEKYKGIRSEIVVDYGHFKRIVYMKQNNAITGLIEYLDHTYGNPSVVIECDEYEYLDYLEKWMTKFGNKSSGMYSLKLRAYNNEFGTIWCTFDYTYGDYSLRIHMIDRNSESETESFWRNGDKKTFDVIYPTTYHPFYSNRPQDLS